MRAPYRTPALAESPVTLVHGLGVSHRYFARLRRLLPHAQAPDLAGASVGALTASLLRVLRPGTLVVANSLGCQVAAEAALRVPVRGLVLIGPTWDPAAPTLARQFLRLANGAYREPPSLLPVLAREYARWGPSRLLATARSMLRHPFAERLALVQAPVVVVRGEHDPVCGGPWAELVAAVAHGRLAVVPGAAHAVHWSHPRAVVEAIEEVEQRAGER
jgi:pimeloyl-ACP methyl ester carboxylesterase